MSEPLRDRLRFGGPPTRLPGQGEVELEPMAGDVQLTRLRTPGSERPAGRPVATERQRHAIYRPHERVPVSGVYDIVDEEGNYLFAQVTCHEGGKFPPSNSPDALAAHQLAGGADHRYGYGYRLAYEAMHLQPQSERDDTIHKTGDRVRISGVYNAVDLGGGEYLHCQRACVEGETFPTTEGLEPGGYGYMLEYEAEHLSHD